MDAREALALIEFARAFGAEDAGVEFKLARSDLPKSVVETLSAFSNSPGGGVLMLGVDEGVGYAVTGVADAGKLQADLASAARTQVAPPLRPEIYLLELEGKSVIAAVIHELPREQKPCYVASRGMNSGSYIRVGEGDRRLTAEEVQQLVANRGQPRFDHEAVHDASIDDLDIEAVDGLLRRVRETNPRLFGHEDAESTLRMLGVIQRTDNGDRPTLAGLLALGKYPQQFFPQLNLTFVHYPTKTGEVSGGVRFLDNVRIEGAIPYMAREALAVIQRNMSRRALISAAGREDVWEYPPEALREAIVNALVHRDFSPGSRGAQVQIEMYPDRLRIMNPGGLYGAIDINRLGEEGVSSSRNALLLKLLEDVPIPAEGGRTVCENRGSGIRTMRAELARAGMSPPEFLDRVTSFQVIMPNHTLFDDDTVRWLSTLGRDGLRDTQRTALALMLKGQVLDNAKYRAATGISDSRVATQELQDLVAREFVDQAGTRGGAKYSLSDYARSLAGGADAKVVRPNRRRQILNLIYLHGELSKSEMSTLLNINPKTTEHWLGQLKREGKIEPTEPGRGNKNTKYRLVDEPVEIPGQVAFDFFAESERSGSDGTANQSSP